MDYQIATVKNINIKLDISFIIFFGVFFVIDLLTGFMSSISLILFSLYLSVLLHEFGHVVGFKMANKDIKCNEIIMSIMGGAALLSHKSYPDKYLEDYLDLNPVQEFLGTIAGPLVNVFIAGILSIMNLLIPDETTKNIAYLNLLIAVFNLIPVYPMDGGRILKSGLNYMFNSNKITRDYSLYFGILGIIFMTGYGIVVKNPMIAIIVLLVLIPGTIVNYKRLNNNIKEYSE